MMGCYESNGTGLSAYPVPCTFALGGNGDGGGYGGGGLFGVDDSDEPCDPNDPTCNPDNAATPDNATCEANILSANNNIFGTNLTSDNVVRDPYNFSQGAPPGQGTLNLDISTDQPGSLSSAGYYPIHWWTYIIGYGSTLHVVKSGSSVDSPDTKDFSPSLYTEHIDSAYPYNPIGLLFHGLLNFTSLGGYPGC
jgi:hypothetical protein